MLIESNNFKTWWRIKSKLREI